MGSTPFGSFHHLAVCARSVVLRRCCWAALLAVGQACGAHGEPPELPPAPRLAAIANSVTPPADASPEDDAARPCEPDASRPDATPDPAPTQPVPEPHYPFQDPCPSDVPTHTKIPATRIARMLPAQCRAELRRRAISVKAVRTYAPGVAFPLRLDGPLHGVRFITAGPRSVYSVLDCRMVLALDDLATVLAPLGVAAIHVDNTYRPRARIAGRKTRSQHSYGLAADIRAFTLADGRTLSVERDYQGQIGEPSCGPQARLASSTAEAIQLRNLVCEMARAQLFHYLLTPNHDAAHRDHLHADIKREARAHVLR